MRKILLPLFYLLLLSLSGCKVVSGAVNGLIAAAINGPERVTIEGVTYRAGFYGELLPVFGQVGDIGSETLQKEFVHETVGYKYRRVDFEGHDWVHCSEAGKTTGGTVYCAESQWESMAEHYANPANFTYYIGGIVVSHDQVDSQKFDELLAFGEEYSYKPFGSNEKAEEKTRRLPEAAYTKGLKFFKVSNDGYFTTTRGTTYFIHEGKLLLVFYYDNGRDNGGTQEVGVIDVPDDLGQYFVHWLELHPENSQ